MSGLEVVALVAAVVSSFAGGKELFSAWCRHRQKKRAKKQHHYDKKVESSMVKGKSKVQNRYDEDFRKFGERFTKGDDQARLELYHHMTTMQNAVIDSLRQAMGGSSRVVVNVDSLHAVSEAARKGSVAALTNQFQRMMQAASIPKTPLPEAEDAKSGPVEQISVARCTGILVVERERTGHMKIYCSSAQCHFMWFLSGTGTRADFLMTVYPEDNDSEVSMSALSLLRQHEIREKFGAWLGSCPICSHRYENFDLDAAVDHVKTHSLPELCGAFEILAEEHGSDPWSHLGPNDIYSEYCCYEAGCLFQIPVDDVRDAELETWYGRLKIFRHKSLQ